MTPSAEIGLAERFAVPVRGRDHHRDVEAELGSELKVAGVVGGNAHDGAGAVGQQDVVGDPDRDGGVGEGVAAEGAGEDAGFLAGGGLAFDLGLAAGGGDVGIRRRRAGRGW